MTQRSWGGGNQTGYLRMYQEVLGQSCGENYSYVRVRTYIRPNSTATFFNNAHRWYWWSWNNSGGAGYGINWTRSAGGHFSAGPRFHRRHTHDAEGNRTLSNATEARHPSLAGFQSLTATRLPTSGYWDVGLPRIARVPNAPAAPTVTRVSIGDTLRASVNMPANNGAAVSHMAFQRRHLHPGGSWSAWAGEVHIATGGTNPTTWDSAFTTLGEQAQFRSRALNCRGWGPWSGASTAFTTSNTPAQVAAPTHSMNRETNVATVNWTNPADRGAAITGYRWERQERGGTAVGTPSFTGTVGGAARTFSTPGAVGNGREVRWRIQAINARGNGAWSAWTGWLAAGDVPVRPNPNAAIAINQTTNVATATFTNPANNGAALTQRRWRFEVAGTVGPWSAWTAIATTTATASVGNGQTVRVMQQVRNARGDSAEGAWTGTVTGGVAPSQVATPTLTAGNVGQMSASWTAPATGGAPITGYPWELRRVGQSALTASGTATATSVTMSVPEGGVEYEFRVRAQSARGQGAWSAWSRATSAVSLPGAPSRVSATASINAQGALIVALAWTNNPEPLSPYQALTIQRRDNVNAQWVAVATLGPAVTSHSTAAQTPLDRLFEYRVVATNSGGQAASGVVGPFASEPLSPTAGSLSVRGDLTIAVRWQSSSTYRAQQTFQIRNGQTAPVGTGGVVVGTISAPAALVSEANGVSTYEFVVGRDGGSAMPNPAVLNSYSIRARATHAPQPWSAATAETPQAQLQTPPGPPQILSPVGFVRPFGAAPGWLILQWVHATLDQSAQTAAEARFSLNGGTTWQALSLAGMVNVSGNTWQVNLPQSLVPWALGGQLAIQMRTRGNDPRWGAWSGAAFSTPTLEASAVIVGPTPTISIARVNLEWAFLPSAPGDVLTQTVVEVYQGNSTAPQKLIWEGTFGAGVTATKLPQILSNGQQVTVSLRVRGSNGFWSSWVRRTFTADFVPPQQIRFRTTFDEEQGTVTLTGLPEGPGAAPDRMTILRATAHGPEEPLQWVALAVNIPISQTFVDRYPPLNAMVVYNMTAVAPVPGTDEYTTAASTDRGALILSGKSPICANSRELARWQQRFGGGPDFPVFPIYYTQSMWLDAGLGFQQRVRGFYNLTISQNIGVVGGSTNYFSGQSWPRHYGGFERTHQVSFSFRVELLNRYPRGGQRNESATPVSEQPGTALSHLIDWQRFFLVARVVVYRDHLGNYFMAHLQPGSVSEVGLGILEISASVTRVMHLRAPAAGLSPGLPGVQAQAAALGASMMQAPTGLSGATAVASADYGDLGQYPDGWIYEAEDVIAEGLPSLYPGDAGYEWNDQR